MGRLQGKTSIITGAGSGIGRGIALIFAKEGAKVVIADKNAVSGQETADMILNSGGDSIFIQADVSNALDAENLVARCMAKYNQLNIICNNAGIMAVEPVLISDLTENLWDQIISVNLKSVYLCCKYSIPQMIQSGGGSIVNIASMAGLVKSPNCAYSASKGGIIALTRSLSLQLAQYNIRANSICPDATDTPGRTATIQNSNISGKSIIQTARLIPRLGTPDDIAYASLFLASDEASYITGATLTVDGGTLRG